jgi:hypothetical protein
VYFWVLAFLLGDLAPGAAVVPAVGLSSHPSLPALAPFEAVVPNR